jgi:hypothetical protein
MTPEKKPVYALAILNTWNLLIAVPLDVGKTEFVTRKVVGVFVRMKI